MNKKTKRAIYMKEYYSKHKAVMDERSNSWGRSNREKTREIKRLYRLKLGVVPKVKVKPEDRHGRNKAYKKKWAQDNKEMLNKRLNERYKNDLNHRLSVLMRSRLGKLISGSIKSGSAVRDLGCSISELKFYLEGKFQDGMTWDNWSLTGWHIDHIIPLSYFDLTDREQFLKACHYTNLQPLWAIDNLIKKDKLPADMRGHHNCQKHTPYLNGE